MVNAPEGVVSSYFEEVEKILLQEFFEYVLLAYGLVHLPFG